MGKLNQSLHSALESAKGPGKQNEWSRMEEWTAAGRLCVRGGVKEAVRGPRLL